MEIIILAIVQSITEFLPISSSGHLVIIEKLYQISINKNNTNIINVLLHFSTMLASIIFFKKEIKKIILNIIKYIFKNKEKSYSKEYIKLFLLILIASIPTAILGLIISNFLSIIISSKSIIALCFILTAIILNFSKVKINPIKNKYKDISIKNAIIIGIVQGFAVIPGVSRSGTTITIALWLGIERKLAGYFSFLISFPAIIGASYLEFRSIEINNIYYLYYLIFAFTITFIASYFILKILFNIIKNKKLHYFAYYCYTIAIIILVFV